MSLQIVLYFALIAAFTPKTRSEYLSLQGSDCGPYGFICEGNSKLRLCDSGTTFGPTFICPYNTICNENSNDVCENAINYIDPAVRRTLRCHRYERIADPTVPGCKGYILCIPNKQNQFQGIKFKCSGNTVFNGFTRSCTSVDKYKCPAENSTKTSIELFSNNRNTESHNFDVSRPEPHKYSQYCKNYKFSVRQDNSPVRAAYFCPQKPVQGELTTRCTVFSNNFCVTLERDDKDLYITDSRAYRRPRLFKFADKL